jgi:hypothetical protein
MKLKTLVALAVAAAFAVPLSTQAQSDKPSSGTSDVAGSTMAETADKDKDGFISREEATGTQFETIFDTLDKNRDGKLSRDEMTPQGAGAGATGGGEPPKKQ